MDILQYINENLPKCVAYTPDIDGELIGLPYPYIMPCAYTGFRAMFYWDTYFIHKGLLVRSDLNQIKNDIDNMRYLIRQYGFVPNANQTFALFNSQPPFLSMMIRDYYENTKDKAWLADAYADLKKEYRFWQSSRTSPIGLTYYDTMPLTPQKIVAEAKQFRDRTGQLYDVPDENEKMLIYVAEEDMVLGYCFCVIEEAKGDNLHPIKSLFIDDLCVDENVRSTGIGTSLYRYVVEEAKKLQCNRITLNVWCLNTSAMKFYEKMGLQPLKIVMEERL